MSHHHDCDLYFSLDRDVRTRGYELYERMYVRFVQHWPFFCLPLRDSRQMFIVHPNARKSKSTRPNTTRAHFFYHDSRRTTQNIKLETAEQHSMACTKMVKRRPRSTRWSRRDMASWSLHKWAKQEVIQNLLVVLWIILIVEACRQSRAEAG